MKRGDSSSSERPRHVITRPKRLIDLWHFCSATDGRKLKRIQERAVQAVFLDKQSSHQALLDKSGLMMLQSRRLQDNAIML